MIARGLSEMVNWTNDRFSRKQIFVEAMMPANSIAGNLPGSVMTRCDLLGTYVRGRLQYAYS